MAGEKNVGTDFASVLTAANKVPEATSDGKDLPDGFPLPRDSQHKHVDTATDDDPIPGIKKYDFRIHRRVYTIFRPWEKCDRCANLIAAEAVELPAETGDYTCPHTHILEYEDVNNKILAGEFLFGSEQEISNPDGSVRISLRWYEPVRKSKK
jgi:hypothetical protein